MHVISYEGVDGGLPFDTWLNTLRDTLARGRILARLRQLENGHFGDWASVGNGVIELRIHVGQGYRVYVGRHGDDLVILLGAGSKRTQATDIASVRWRWADWKRRFG